MFEELVIGAAISYFVNFLYDISKKPFNTTVSSKEVKILQSVEEFYSNADSLPSGTKVTIKGTFSNYIPILSGQATIKRDLHLEFRKNIQQLKVLFDKRSFRIQETTLNYLMSLSAGQMIMYPKKEYDSLFIPCAMYESIVRNSILILIHKDIYSKIHHTMQKQSPHSDFAEATITGIIDTRENSFVQHIHDILFKFKGVERTIDFDKLKSLAKTKVIYILNDGIGKFQYNAPSRFLDGDIWMSIKHGKEEELITRFLNLANYNEMLQQAEDMVSEYNQSFCNWEITGTYCS